MADVIELTKEEQSFFDSKGQATTEPEKAVETPPPVEETKAAPVAEAAPEATEEAEEAKTGGDPRKALHEERERRRAIAKERDEFKVKYAALESRLNTLTDIAKSSQQPPKQDAKPEEIQIPDINTDPVGHFRAKDAIREREVAELRTKLQAQETQSQTINNVQRISQLAQAHEAEFIKGNPDYNEASSYLRTMRDAELQAYGIADPIERQNMIAQDAITIAANSLAQNKNPAQVIYEIAKARGYKATPPKQEQALQRNAPSEAEKVRMAAAGQKAGQSLGQINGAAKPAITPEALLAMSEEEFAEATKGNNWRKLLGG